MEWTAVLTSSLALIFVLCLIGLVSYFLRRVAGQPLPKRGISKEGKRLGIVEVMALDVRRRLVLIRRDDKEHLLLLAPDRELLIENVGAQTKGRKK
jgi:flagellar protein FliO/FliZ